MELCSPLLLVLDYLARAGRPSWRRPAARLCAAYVWGFVAFHVLTFAAISSLFLPHVVCLLAFAPLERTPRWLAHIRTPRSSATGLIDPPPRSPRHAAG